MIAGWYRWRGETLVMELRVQPRASRDEVVGVCAGRLRVRIRSAPVDGKANQRLVALMAAEFHVPKSRVELLHGARGREKRIAVTAPRRRPAWLDEGGQG